MTKLGKPYLLSVKVLVRDKNGNCLVLKRSLSSKANAGKWEFPGGKVDQGENFEKALVREVKEETGLTISLSRLIGAQEVELPERKIIYLILEGYFESGQVCLSDEHENFLWAKPHQIIKMDLVEQFKRFVEENISKI